MTPQPARTDVELRMMEAMVDCAQALATGFAGAARAEPDLQRQLQLDMAFHRGFQAVRLGIRLCLTLRAGPAAGLTRQPTQDAAPERETSEREIREHETARDLRVREPVDRDRDYEPVSLSRFLTTLRGVAADAGREPNLADPAVLPTLEGLLAQAEPSSPPRPAAAGARVALLTRPPAPLPKARLLGSTAPTLAPSLAGRPRPPPHPSG